MKNSLSYTLVLVILSTLSACASLPGQKKSPESVTVFPGWLSHQTQLNSLTHWQVTGRIFIQASEDGFSSNIDWINQGETFHIRFSAPMGQGVYDLRGNSQTVTMTLPDNSQSTAKDPESLLKKNLGVKLPVSGLSYWIRGLPDPHEESRDIVLDTHERLINLRQSGWEISIRRYQQFGVYFLPDKLTMSNRHVKIKMALKNWTLDEATSK